MTAVTNLCIRVHAQFLVLEESRAASRRNPADDLKAKSAGNAVDDLHELIGELRTLPTGSTDDAAAKLRVVAGLFDEAGRLDPGWREILGESVGRWIERVASDLDTL